MYRALDRILGQVLASEMDTAFCCFTSGNSLRTLGVVVMLEGGKWWYSGCVLDVFMKLASLVLYFTRAGRGSVHRQATMTVYSQSRSRFDRVVSLSPLVDCRKKGQLCLGAPGLPHF
jgi:hypothetical protein